MKPTKENLDDLENQCNEQILRYSNRPKPPHILFCPVEIKALIDLVRVLEKIVRFTENYWSFMEHTTNSLTGKHMDGSCDLCELDGMFEALKECDEGGE